MLHIPGFSFRHMGNRDIGRYFYVRSSFAYARCDANTCVDEALAMCVDGKTH